MPKASSPVRLEADLMAAAKLSGSLFKRSASEQIEYWASIGRNVADILNPNVLLDITNGVAKLKVEAVEFDGVDADAVFENLESDRTEGKLEDSLGTISGVRYQASETHKGFLEQISPDGKVVTGKFNLGEFIPALLDKS